VVVAASATNPTINLKRAYDPPSAEDGRRILVERLWPRGLSKDAAQLADWVKALSPSPALRKWHAHDIGKWETFQARYREELTAKAEALQELAHVCQAEQVTFVFAAKDTIHNSASVLKAVIEENLR